MNDSSAHLGVPSRLARFPLEKGPQSKNTLVGGMPTLIRTTRSGTDANRTRIDPKVAGKTPLPKKIPSESGRSFHSSFNLRHEKSSGSRARWLPLHSPLIDRLTKTPAEMSPRASNKGLNAFRRNQPFKGGKPPSNLSLYNLLDKLPKDGLTNREIQRRFGISKSSIESLVAKGVLGEHWGSKGVGVKYRSTAKGQTRLKGIREMSGLVSKKDAFTSLKTRFPT